MKFLASAAFLAAGASACMVDGDYSCHCLPQNFYAKQREAYMLYYSLMKSHGYDLNEGHYNPWQPTTTSKYAYQEYIPGENPYLGRWKSDDDSCWITAKDATRLNHHPVQVADEFVEKVEDDLNVTVEVVPNETLEAEEVIKHPTFADRIKMLRGDYDESMDFE